MRVYMCITLALWSMAVTGCSLDETQGAGDSLKQTVEREHAKVSQNRAADIIKIERLVLTEDALMLDYRVNNIYPYDIWLCEDIDTYEVRRGSVVERYEGPPVAETWIIDDILRIRLVGNLDHNIMSEKNTWTRYRRLAPQQERSHTIRLALPVQDQSPIFNGDYPRTGKKPRVLHYVLFRVGFFKRDLPALLGQSLERGWPFKNGDPNAEFWEITTHTPPKSKDPNVIFIPVPWKGVRLLEHCAQSTITDVNIPAQVATRRVRKYCSW